MRRIGGVDDVDRMDVAAYSCSMRWKSALRAGALDRTAMPGYFASNALPSRSATGRSTEVYQTTLPSFLAASISAGVIVVAAGAAADGRGETLLVPTRRNPAADALAT